jgi:hypothetical protein
MTGRVIDIDTLDRGWRVIIAPDALTGLDASQQPRRLRIHISAASDLLSPGDRVSLKAMLYPVPGQAAMDTPADRAAHYRKQAADLRAKAAKEPDGSMLKDQFRNLAKQYDRLATQVENSSYR